jgi:hypothetical protein
MRRLVFTLALVAVAGATLAPAATGAGARHARAPSGDPCGPGLIEVGDGLCTHGGDRIPIAVERAETGVAERADELARKMKKANPRCAGDGAKGPRIRVFYGFPADTTSRAEAFGEWIRRSVVLADSNLDRQSPGIKGQHLRMYCRNGRKVTVSAIRLLPIGQDGVFTFGDVISSLTDRQGHGLGAADFDAPRFTYVVFVDNVTCCYGPAGQGTIYYDDRADPAGNVNNLLLAGPRFAMVEIGGTPSAGAYIFLHEVGHTLGAVQDSAPHSSGAGHCYTGADVMCYADGGPWFQGGGSMESVCPPMPDGQRPFDCEGGDYYELDPAPGSYLDAHWNTADSGWLTRPG